MAAADIPQVNPGPTWFDLFKPYIPRPRPPAPALAAQSVNCTGSFTLAPLSFTPPLLRGVTTASTGSSAALSSYTISNPSWNGTGSYAGDIILLWVGVRGANAPSTPAGFTAVPALSTSNTQIQLFYRVSDGTEGSTFTISYSAAAVSSAECRSYYNVDTTLIMDPAVPSASGVAGLAATGITTTRNYDALVWFAVSKSASSGQLNGIITPPPGFVTIQPPAATTSGTTPNIQAFGADKFQATAGATGTLTGTDSAPSVDTTTASLVVAVARNQVSGFGGQGAVQPWDAPQVNPGSTWSRLFRPWAPRPIPPLPALQSVNTTTAGLAEIAGAPWVTATTGATLTTASFTPTAGALLVAIVTNGDGSGVACTSITVTDSVSGTWIPLVTDRTGAATGVFVKDAGTSPAAQTVTATFNPTGTLNGGMGIVVRQFTGALPAASQNGATRTAGGFASTVTGITIVPRVTGSQIVGAYGNSTTNISVTANGSTSIYGQQNNAPESDTEAAFKASSLSIAGVPVTLGFTSTGSFSQNFVAAEILPRGFPIASLGFAAQGAQTSPDQPQVSPGPSWLDLFKPWIPTRPAPLAAASLSGITSTGSFSLAGLAFSAQGAQTSPDFPSILPGSTWLRLFSQWVPKPVPVPPAFQSVNVTGSFSIAPLAFAANAGQTSPDVPQIQPGSTWFDLFKPWFTKPRPVPPARDQVTALGSFVLAPLAFSANGAQTSPDLPQVNPGSIWLRLFKPSAPKPPPWQPSAPFIGISSAGGITLAPLVFSSQGAQTSPDFPSIQPGTSWLKFFKPWVQRVRPVPPAFQSVASAGSFSLAPLVFTASGAQTSRDVPSAQPGLYWLRLFKPWIQRPVPPPPARDQATASGGLTLAPLVFSAQGAQSSPDVTQVFPGPFWLRLFRPWITRPVPPPPAFQAVGASGGISLAGLAFSGTGAITASAGSLPQVNPGPGWLAWFKHWYRPLRPDAPPTHINSTGGISLAPLAFHGTGPTEPAGIKLGIPYHQWVTGTPRHNWRIP